MLPFFVAIVVCIARNKWTSLMKITANHIESWANTRQAQAELPIFIRKLISATNSLSELVMPGGDSVYRTGWDGQITCSDTSAWVPEGKSVWEMGCNTNIASKANSDFNKRTEEFNEEFQRSNSFIFVTPYRWHKKENWLNEKKNDGSWKEIKVLDADDLEVWFENAPAVALEFGELIGIVGSGVESVTSYWANWSKQSLPNISINAIQQDREQAKKTFLDLIENQTTLIKIEADSHEEATAFCCSALLGHPLNTKAACIIDDNGWSFVNTNPALKIAILASTQLNLRQAPREGITLIQPICHGDDINSQANNSTSVSIPRISSDTFKQALVELGEEENDARRLTKSSGRSWSVYRRFKAQNPLIRKPSWLDGIDKECLVILLLVGAWNSSSKGDIALIEELTKQPYEDFEDSLSHLVTLDDSPVLNIGNVWKAKSPIELLYLIAPKLSKSKLIKFISLVKSVLSKPDPKLELPESERWMANIQGKVRDESGIIIKSLLNSLIKLKVFAETSQVNISNDIVSNVDKLFFEVLFNANEETWMSLSSYLPSIAEASPDIFMQCVEGSLSDSSQPIACLIKNTTASGFGNCCWYSGLLWGLETIAWSSSQLFRVTNILIDLDKIPNNSNWGNKPFTTLQSFYRPHWPQCLATVDQKVQILKAILEKDESFAWRFIFSLIPRGGSIGLNNSRPVWRDDDAGSESERNIYYPHYISWFVETVLKLAKGNPNRISELMDCYQLFDGEYKEDLVLLIEELSRFDDNGKEIILSRLRKHISFYQSDYIDDKDDYLERIKSAYYNNQPQDIIIRYRWLFQSQWINLPEGERRDYKKSNELLDQYRLNAIEHIWEEHGASGIERLLMCVEDSWLVGNYTARHLQSNHFNELMLLSFNLFIKNSHQYQDPFLDGVLSHVAFTKQSSCLKAIKIQLHERKLTSKQQVSVVACLPPNMDVFTFIDSLGEEVAEEYWRNIHFSYRVGKDCIDFVLNNFILLKRYNSAFKLIENCLEKIPPKKVFEILRNLLRADEGSDTLPDGYWIDQAIKFISESGEISQHELAILEFAFLPIFSEPSYVPPNLLNELLTSPQTFVELVCYVYPEEGKYKQETNIESNGNATHNAFKVLHYGRGVPGLIENEGIDALVFNKWIQETRQIGRKMDREAMTDQSIGQWLSNCPEEEEGVWPCYPVCELLEKVDASEIREGFSIGVRNNRGVTYRAYNGGGDSERKLALKYREYADKLNNKYPQTSSLLNDIAKSYFDEAKREDDNVSLNNELD